MAAVAAVAVLLWAATYGAYSGPKEFLYDVSLTDVLLVAFTAVLAYATYLLYRVTRELRRVAQRQDQHYTLTERAYLELSHAHPGITWKDGRPWVQIKIENKGNSPCRLVDFKIGFSFWRRQGALDRPPPPVYGEEAEYIPSKGFLVPDAYIYAGGGLVKGPTNYGARARMSGETLLAYCYAEYVDIFGNLHHAGWGREYEGVNEGKQNNLGYLSSDDYNYDRPAKLTAKG